MKRSSMGTYRPVRLVALCFLAMSVLTLVSGSKPWAAGRVAATVEHLKSPGEVLKNDLSPHSTVTGNFTLNKYVFPGNTTFTSVSPTLVPSPPQITSWSIGVPILYVITIGNSNPLQTTPVNITLTDAIAGGLGANFVLLNVSCVANTGNSAVCGTLPSAGSPMPLVIPNNMIQVGGSNDLVFSILGYYTGPNNYQNTFSVFETGKQSTTEEQGPSKNILITNNWSPLDLKIAKTSNTNDTSISTTNPATIHYEVTLTGDSSHDFYPQNLLRIEDLLHDGVSPLPGYSISASTPYCTTVNGSTCPAAPSPATPNLSTSGSNSYAYTYLTWPAGMSTVIKKGDVITLKFDVDVSEGSCGNSSLAVQNHATIQMNGFAYSDSNNGNNSASATANTFTTGLQPCVPPTTPGTVSKTRVCPSSGCPIVNWGDTITYQITVKNNLTTTQAFKVIDYMSKQSITVPFRATLQPNSLPADVTCTPATVVCTTTPATTVPPVDLIVDTQWYTFFTTAFTLPPNGDPAGDSVTLTFNVKFDKLSECQTDIGNFFENVGSLYLSSGAFVAQSLAPAVKLPDLPTCNLNVKKVLDQPLSGVIFGQPVSYTVTYENLSSQAVTVHTLRDVVNIRDNSAGYSNGNIPLTNVQASCTTTTGVSPMPSYQLTTPQIYLSNPDWAGIPIIHETSQATGITFPANSNLVCTVSFTPQAPSATDNSCQGKGQPELLNNAFIDVSGLMTWAHSPKPAAPYFAQATAPLPLCRKVSVLKMIGGGVASTGPNGLLTFQIDVTNYGNDPVHNFLLNDPLPNGFTDNGPVICNPVTACISANFSGTSPRTLNAAFNPIPGTALSPTNKVTLTFNVNASPFGGTSENTATGSFGAGPPGTNFYFEGDPAVLLVNSAQVQVLTPTLTKTIQPNSIAVNGSAVLTFTVTNQTSDPAQTGISFTDTLPSGVTVTNAPSLGCGGNVSVSGGNTITLSNGTMPQGMHQCSIVVNVTASSCGTFENDQTNFSNVTNLDVTNADATLTVTGCPPTPTKPTLTKNFEQATIGPTGTTTLAFTITNSSGDPKQTGISFSDTLPAGLQFVSVIANGCGGSVNISNGGQTVTLTGGNLVGSNADGSGKHTCQILVQVKATGECGLYPNTKDNFSNVTNLDVSGVNQQLEVVDCRPPSESCSVKTNEISCKADGTGGYLYTFTVTNNTGQTVTDILLTPPPNSNFTLSQQQFSLLPRGLANGASITLSVTIKGGQPKQGACFDVTLLTREGECCTTRVCPVLPECCGVAQDVSIECNGDGTYTYTLSIINTGVDTIEHMYIYPPAGVTITPNYFALSLAPSNTFTTKVTIKGAKPGDKLCFDISLHNANMESCCKGQHCIFIPECPASGRR